MGLRFTPALSLLAGTALLAGCAGMGTVHSDVSSFGDWPAGRAPGTYAFDRLPSQQAQGSRSDAVEGSARPALERAGFKPAEPGQQPDVLVQVGARDGLTTPGPWADPLWWNGGFGYWRHGPWLGPRWGYGVNYYYGPNSFPRYEREVALLIRDRASGKPLFETHASSEGNGRADPPVLQAMFQAALMDFPRLGLNPRPVSVAIQPR